MKIFTRITAALLCSMSMAVRPAFAATSTTVTPVNTAYFTLTLPKGVAVGQSFVVPINLKSGGASFDSARAVIIFPTQLLDVTGVQIDGLLKSELPGNYVNEDTGYISFGAFDPISNTGGETTKDGVLANITFKAISSGTGDLKFSSDSHIVSNGLDESNSTLFQNGSISVSGGVPQTTSIAPSAAISTRSLGYFGAFSGHDPRSGPDWTANACIVYGTCRPATPDVGIEAAALKVFKAKYGVAPRDTMEQNVIYSLAYNQPVYGLKLVSSATPTSSDAVGCTVTDDLSYGSTGSQVSCLQAFLTAQGQGIYPAARVTGVFSDMTLVGVKRFQALHGLTASGLVDAATRAAISAATTVATTSTDALPDPDPAVLAQLPKDATDFSAWAVSMDLQYGMRNLDVAYLQRFLSVSPVTGVFGNRTTDAVKAYQAKKQLSAVGSVGQQTRAAIKTDLGK